MQLSPHTSNLMVCKKCGKKKARLYYPGGYPDEPTYFCKNCRLKVDVNKLCVNIANACLAEVS